MERARALGLFVFAFLVVGACGGETQVSGGVDTETTGGTGATATAPTATGATGATGPTGAAPAAGGAFSVELGEYPPEVQDVAFFACDGLEGTWRCIFRLRPGHRLRRRYDGRHGGRRRDDGVRG